MEGSLKRGPIAEPVELRGVVWAIWLAFAVLTLSATGPDPDLWGHLRFGLDWWNTFSLPLTDPYSFTQDRPWINHEWLSEAAMGAAYLAGGVTGLIVLKMFIIGASLAVLYRRLRGATPLVIAVALSLAIVGVLPISLTIRPQLWSVLGLACVASLLDRSAAPSSGRMLLCALLFALWANLHGGWITGATVLAAYSGIRTIRAWRDAYRWLGLLGAGLGATLVNPYGVGLWRFLASTVRASRPDITEWQPMGLDSPVLLWVPIATTAILVVLLNRRPETRPPVAVSVALVILLVAALRVHRVAPLMGPAGLVFLAPSIRQAWGSVGRLRAPNIQAARVLWVPVVVAALAVARPVTTSLVCLRIEKEWAPDLTMAPALRGLSGKLVTTFDWGEYSIWHFGPALRVSIDGRRETVYSNSVIQLHRRFERGEAEALEQVRELDPDYVWLPASRTSVKRWLAANGYRIDAESSASFLAVRTDHPPIQKVDRPMPACFP